MCDRAGKDRTARSNLEVIRRIFFCSHAPRNMRWRALCPACILAFHSGTRTPHPFPPLPTQSYVKKGFDRLVQQFESQPKVRLLLIVTTQESEDNELRERSWLKV